MFTWGGKQKLEEGEERERRTDRARDIQRNSQTDGNTDRDEIGEVATFK
jgi:hypothetical protein